MDKLLKGARPIHFKFDYNLESYQNFSKDFDHWILSSKLNVKGLPEPSYIVSGITDSFNQLYGLYNKFGIFEGEYGYHKLVLNDDRITYNLKEADCIIVSYPFSADGLSSMSKIEIADSYNKPIFIDCAFFGICDNIDFDFRKFKNIRTIAFSLSKTFGTGFHRIGKIFTLDKFPVSVYEEWGYHMLSNAEVHYNLIKTIGPDDTFARHREKQIKICKELDLIPSDTVIFGLDYTEKYKNYNRGNVNRICISKLLEDEYKDEKF
jgi:hypothetical protein